MAVLRATAPPEVTVARGEGDCGKERKIILSKETEGDEEYEKRSGEKCEFCTPEQKERQPARAGRKEEKRGAVL